MRENSICFQWYTCNISRHVEGAPLFFCAGINGSLSIMVTGNNSGAPPLTSFELMHARVNDLFTATTSFCALRSTAHLRRSSPGFANGGRGAVRATCFAREAATCPSDYSRLRPIPDSEPR
jgi:hypothetical protein